MILWGTVAEPMPVDNEDINNLAATVSSPGNSVRSTADAWCNAETLVGPEPLSLLATPNIDRQAPRWSTQVLAQLRAVPGYDKDTVFRAEQTTASRHVEAPELHHGQPQVPRYGQSLVSSHNQAPRPRHDQVLDAVSSSYQLPVAAMRPTQDSRPIPRPSDLLRISNDPTRAEVEAWLQSVDGTLPDDLTSPATPTDLHSARPEQIAPTPPPFWVPKTAALRRNMPSPGDQMAPHRQAKERWSSPSPSSCLPSIVTASGNSSPFAGNQVAWEKTRFFHASHSPSTIPKKKPNVKLVES